MESPQRALRYPYNKVQGPHHSRVDYGGDKTQDIEVGGSFGQGLEGVIENGVRGQSHVRKGIMIPSSLMKHLLLFFFLRS